MLVEGERRTIHSADELPDMHFFIRGITLAKVEFDTGRLADISRLTALAGLFLSRVAVSDGDLAGLGNVDSLQKISFSNCRGIGDATLVVVGQLPKLEELYVSGTSVTDEGFAHLSGLTGLRTLEIHDRQVTDAALEALSGLESLKRLKVDQTQITADGVARLREALPNCTFTWDGGTLSPVDYDKERETADDD